MAELLLQDGDELLLQSGDQIVLQSGPTAVFGYVNLSSNPRAPLDIGDRPLCTAEFFDRDDVAADPTAVEFVWRTPNGTETTYTWGVDDGIDTDGTGVFLFLAPEIVTHGRHTVRVAGLEGLVAAGELNLGVRMSAFPAST